MKNKERLERKDDHFCVFKVWKKTEEIGMKQAGKVGLQIIED